MSGPLPALARELGLRGAPETKIPRLVYGTAWKKDRTAELVYQAIKAGFRGIDTAAQPRHYNEALVAEGVRRAIAEGIVTRKELFIQTKFTPPGGQDLDNMPYDASAPLEEQITSSVASSLSNFTFTSSSTGPVGGADSEAPYLDSLVLHSPYDTVEKTLQALTILKERYVPAQIRHLGISNLPSTHFEILDCGFLSVVQNRFYPATGWEGTLRAICRRQGIVFQTFWTLSGNPQLVSKAPFVGEVADKAGVSRQVAMYALVLGLQGTTILDGTTNEAHMTEDLEGIVAVGRWAEGEGKPLWEKCLGDFKRVIREIVLRD